MIEALCNAYNAVNHLTEEEIYQVSVRRGIPADIYALFGETHERLSVGGQAKKYVDMSEDELAAAAARNSAQRQVLVAKMILYPRLSYKKADGREIEETQASDPDETYPVEALSERYMKTLQEAHQVVNVPAAGLRSLQRHFRTIDRDTDGTQASGNLWTLRLLNRNLLERNIKTDNRVVAIPFKCIRMV